MIPVPFKKAETGFKTPAVRQAGSKVSSHAYRVKFIGMIFSFRSEINDIYNSAINTKFNC